MLPRVQTNIAETDTATKGAEDEDRGPRPTNVDGEAEQALARYCHDLLNALDERDGLGGSSKGNFKKTVHEAKIWIQENQLATNDNFDGQKDDLEG